MFGEGGNSVAEMEPGNPDELVQTLRNWLREAHAPIGTLPEGMDPVVCSPILGPPEVGV
jgi:hypothetical protein